MQKNNSKANYIYSVVYQLLTVLTPLLTAPYLARVIGADGVGIYSYFNNIASYFAMFGMLGLDYGLGFDKLDSWSTAVGGASDTDINTRGFHPKLSFTIGMNLGEL